MRASEWLKVNKAHPCPICKKADWCTYTDAGDVACCMRVQSDKAASNGGWIHRLTERAPLPPPTRRTTPPPAPELNALAYWTGLMTRDDYPKAEALAIDLGVSITALVILGAVWDPAHQAFAVPMRDSNLNTVGIRLRAMDGKKWAVKGSHEGLFYDPCCRSCDDPVICEGPTDTAAALTLGLPAIGRPSCSGAVMHVGGLLQRWGAKRVTIIADADEPKKRPDGSIFYPGKDGALRMAQTLHLQYRMVMPPAKDIRQWIREGGTREQFDVLANNSPWRN